MTRTSESAREDGENPLTAGAPSPRTSGGLAAVVYNPVRVGISALRERVEAEERRCGWEPSRWFATAREDSGEAAARQALDTDPSMVIVAGGDGTISTVAQVVRGRSIPLALVPAGTGNLLARNLGLPVGDVPSSIHTAFTGQDRPIDIAVAELQRADGARLSRVFLVMAGIGLDASMAENTNAVLKRRLGWIAYTDPIGRSVLANRQFAMHYRIDGARTQSIRAHTVIVGNCGTLTANILLLPDAVVDDGLLDVVVLRPKGTGGWARIGSRLAVGGILHRSTGGRALLRGIPRLNALQYVQARRLSVRFNTPQSIEFDGDSVGAVTGVAIAAHHSALTIRVP